MKAKTVNDHALLQASLMTVGEWGRTIKVCPPSAPFSTLIYNNQGNAQRGI